jgi:antagonist of KipI
MTIAIVRSGILTTVQDLGRRGYGAFGIPPCGAMDDVALRLANRLVGNDDGCAALELTLGGPQLRFESPAVFALAGAAFEATIDGRAVPWGETVAARAGETLSIGESREGLRAILAFAGGLDVPLVLGSRSTFLAAGFGGFDGRALRAGDRLAIAGRGGEPPRRRLRAEARRRPELSRPLRVLLGPQADAFTEAGRRAFLGSRYRVSPRADRMGVRLEGPPIARAAPADVPPEGIAPGAIQVPADARPIVLGVDRPTTGGYTKIATVVAADLWRLAQARPGDELRFLAVDLDEARRLFRAEEELLRSALEGPA